MTNWNFTAHVIRDVFGQRTSIGYYGEDMSCTTAFLSDEHSMGTCVIHSNAKSNEPYTLYWSAGKFMPPVGPEYLDLFLSVDYNPSLPNKYDPDLLARGVHLMLKPKGFVFLVNPGPWYYGMRKILYVRQDLEIEIRRFKMFSDQDIAVYQKV